MTDIEGTYPTRSLCIICHKRQNVVGGELENHSIVDHQITDAPPYYACTVTMTCPGSGAIVSTWTRVP